MCPKIYCGPSLRRRGSLRKSSHTPKYAPVFGAPRSLQTGLLATISGHILRQILLSLAMSPGQLVDFFRLLDESDE